MISLKDSSIIGALSWYAVHPTSMNNTNVLVSSDNVGYASVLLEQALNQPGMFPGKVNTNIVIIFIERFFKCIYFRESL